MSGNKTELGFNYILRYNFLYTLIILLGIYIDTHIHTHALELFILKYNI